MRLAFDRFPAAGRDFRGRRDFAFPQLQRISSTSEPRSQALCSGIHLAWRSERALPHRCHAPSRFQQLRLHLPIPSDIGFELGCPELSSGRWRRGVPALFMPMPVAAVHEDHGIVFRQNQIRPSNDVLRVQAISESSRMQGAAQSEFGLRVLPPDPRHHPRAGCLVHDVSHLPPGLVSRTWYTPVEPHCSGA